MPERETMKTERAYPSVVIDARGTKKAQGGHPWVFDNEITQVNGTPEDGGLCDVLSPKGRYLGTGYYNSHSKIRVRMISQNANDTFGEAFFQRRVRYAWDYRKTVMGPEGTQNCRVIFGESDGFPGLTVDKFGDILVAQTLCLGTELRKDWIFQALAQALEEGRGGRPGDLRAQRREDPGAGGHGPEQGLVRPARGRGCRKAPKPRSPKTASATRWTLKTARRLAFSCTLEKYNRQAAARIAPGKTVLDCFTHTGSFGLNCAKAGAKRVHSVDITETAIACAKENAARNGLSVEYEVANVFDLLPTLTPGEYDYIILDPPAFTKSGKTVKNAERGYKEINYRAMKALPRGGYLATCSCSHFMTDALFRKMLQSAASDAQVELRLVEARAQGPDHPILWNVPETDYLKFYIFQVV